jgi:hypothetical protein
VGNIRIEEKKEIHLMLIMTNKFVGGGGQ